MTNIDMAFIIQFYFVFVPVWDLFISLRFIWRHVRYELGTMYHHILGMGDSVKWQMDVSILQIDQFCEPHTLIKNVIPSPEY